MNKDEYKKIIVTGGSGFIGHHLVKKLLEHGYDVFVLDKQKPTNEDVKWVEADILKLGELVKCMSGVDVVYHLAAIADATFAAENPLLTIKINVEGTANVLEACRRGEVKRVIYASTIWIYNASEKCNVDENTPLSTRTKHVYTTSKLLGEFLCQDYHDHYGLNFTILRFGIPYGPGGRFNVIPIFIKKALLGEPLTIRGTGEQKRQFVYVEDLALGCIGALKKVAENQIYNLVGSQMFSVNEIVETIKKFIPNVEIVKVPERRGELSDKYVSAFKAEKELGWKATTSLDEGIRKTIEWYKSALSISK
ncbi:MAG: NAD-dependent epimerase/dehydratase family protein [Thermoproteota archaeon]